MIAITEKTKVTLGAVALAASAYTYVARIDSAANAATVRVDRFEQKVDQFITIASELRTDVAVLNAKSSTTIERMDRIAAAVKELRTMRR